MSTLSRSSKTLAVALLALWIAAAHAAETRTKGARDILADLKAAEAQLSEKLAEADKLPDSEEGRQQRLGLLATPLQGLGNQRMFAGDAHGALEALDRYRVLSSRAMKTALPADLDRIAAATTVDAIEAIMQEARKRQIVILNESHHVPMHRAFAMLLARELRKIGYTHLAAETFSDRVMAKGYVDQHSGYYVNDPVFANFVRDAAKDGWKLAAYEHSPADWDAENKLDTDVRQDRREAGQARNIVERILAKDPKAKIFVFAGYGHAAKYAMGEVRMMALHLKEMSGIDPLSVDQSFMFQHVLAEAHMPLYPELAKKAGAGPVVLRAPSGRYEVFSTKAGGFDLQVTHPPYRLDAATGRPVWLAQLGGYAPHAIPAKLMPASGRRLVLAVRPGSAIDEVPLDAVLLEAGKKAPMLMIPPVPFEIRTRD